MKSMLHSQAFSEHIKWTMRLITIYRKNRQLHNILDQVNIENI